MGCLCLGIVAFFNNLENFNWRDTAIMALSLILLYYLKYYYAAILLPILATSYIMRILTIWKPEITKGRGIKFRLWIGIFVVFLLMASSLHPNLNPDRFFEVLIKNHDLTVQLSNSDNLIHYHELTPSVKDILINLPTALFAGLFRPLMWEGKNLWQFFTGFENLFLLLLTISSIWYWIKERFRIEHIMWFTPCFIYILILSSLLSLSTPNLGALARYKVGFLPFFVCLISINNALIQRVGRIMGVS